jgi:hypothetical protein
MPTTIHSYSPDIEQHRAKVAARRHRAPPIRSAPADPAAYWDRVRTELAKQARIKAARQRRLRQKYLAREARRLARVAEEDRIERIAEGLYPWDAPLLQMLRAMAPGPHPLTTRATVWALFTIFGDRPEVVQRGIPSEVVGALRRMCPFPTRLSDLRAIVDFLADRPLVYKADYPAEKFRAYAWESAEQGFRQRAESLGEFPAKGLPYTDIAPAGTWCRQSIPTRSPCRWPWCRHDGHRRDTGWTPDAQPPGCFARQLRRSAYPRHVH